MELRTYEEAPINMTGSGNQVKWLVDRDEGSNVFEIREISIPPHGKSSYGTHAHEHGVFVLSGKGRLVGRTSSIQLLPKSSVYVSPNEEHQWVNDSASEPLVFICVIPTGSEDDVKKLLNIRK
ncbi:MAG: cupin domain-containing protein [Sphaerochaeta sp.]|nr:cupin domain-containing protein [Sphaerochaeta sp.]